MRHGNTMLGYRCALASVILLAGGSAGLAHDLNPPPWRGAQYSSFAEFTFPTPMNPVLPKPGAFWGDGAPGPPTLTLGPSFVWEPSLETWISGGTDPTTPGIIEIFMPNWLDNEPIKWVQVQFTWQGNPSLPPLTPGGPPSILDILSSPPTSGGLINVTPDMVVDPTNGLFHRTELWEIRPNPDFEYIIIGVPVDTAIHQIVVDTISFPTPGPIGVAGLGLLMAARRRRR